MKTKTIPIKNLNCQSCTAKLPNIPNTTFKTSLVLQKIMVTYDDTKTNIGSIKQKLKKNGFVIAKRQTHEFVFFLTTLNLILIHIYNNTHTNITHTNMYIYNFLHYFVCYVLYWFCMYKIARTGNFISILGSILAFFDTNKTTSIFILWYLVFGKLILDFIYKSNERMCTDTKNYDYVDDYEKKVGDRFCSVKINEIKPGDIVKVNPYQTVPIDGQLIAVNKTHGKKDSVSFALIDESMLTGESKLVKKQVGEDNSNILYAGTKNQNSTLIVRTCKTKKETLQGQIISILQKNTYKESEYLKNENYNGSKDNNSSNNDTYSRSNIYKRTESNVTMARFYEILLVYCIFVFIVHFFMFIFDCQPFLFSYEIPILVPFKIVMNIVVIACPCALNLAKPLTSFIVSKMLRKHGIILCDTECLTKKIDVVVFDKTGTLTDGFVIEDMIYYGFMNVKKENCNYDDIKTKGISVTKENVHCDEALIDFLYLLLTIEKNNEHLLAKVIYKYCSVLLENQNCNIEIQNKTCEYVPGFGIKGTIISCKILGCKKDEIKINYQITKENNTHFVYFNNFIVAKFEVTEKIKNGAINLIEYFYKQKINVILCSGDTEKSVEHVVKELGIQKYHFKQTSEMKYGIIKELKRKYVTMMVGDGINDLPALKAADVSISVNAVYNESSVSIVNENIMLVKVFCLYADTARRRIRFCYNFSLIYNIICVLVASGVFIIFDFYLDVGKSCLLMFWSSLFVIGNALWICKVRVNKVYK